MAHSLSTAGSADRRAERIRRMVAICLAGIAIGLFYNWLGQRNPRGWGLDWKGVDRVAEMGQLPVVGTGTEDDSSETAADPYLTTSSDPLAVDGGSSSALPEIPALGRPVEIQLQAVQEYVDAGGALIIDAREAEEFAEGHIPGAINLPYDEVVTDPLRLESLETSGRPIITYCGGGTCELSLSLAYELFAAGHERVAVYMGGFPEWAEKDLPVSTGPAE